MPSEIGGHSTRVYAVQTGFWTVVVAVVASAVGYGNSVTLAGIGIGGAILVSAVALELAER
ncbi:hypothetical protein EXE44_00385 [Halorubrum sp. SS7]|uniref:hypothetical protein n=1 Tax=unclassified Halorubrum TaxID=2642239 RepID=UPI0010F888B1|nr:MULTISPECIES: hypothetical protein [unclassified Halorubrum]TKX55667.1 hypothetical protein EXE45_18235 [Halorubrum sp. SP9]TKX59990.1 hypothetical protein EXE44_00385 [Halorubrum sp. SS7]